MGIFKRIFGICETSLPQNPNCWRYDNGTVKIELASAKELATPGGAIRLEGGELPTRLMVVHGTDGAYHAFANKCTHFGRRLDPLPGRPQVQCCSVGKSTFEYGGTQVAGPAKGDLTVYPVESRNGTIFITLHPST